MEDTSLVDQIQKLKAERNAVILVHNYQEPEIHRVADYVGDSLELARLAASTTAEVIVFCGVHFMAETASILSPEKIVLLPEADAGCPMADMVTLTELAQEKRNLPGYTVVTYVNSSAEVKAVSDVCVTSANAIHIVNSLEGNDILFVPDQYLAAYVKSKTGKNIKAWPGYCLVHARIRAEHIIEAKSKHPSAPVIAHPECRAEVLELADEVLSTSGMVRYAKQSASDEIIVATDAGMLYRLGQESPGKKFIAANPEARCRNMQKTKLPSVLRALQEMSPEVKVPEEIRVKALKAVQKMVEMG